MAHRQSLAVNFGNLTRMLQARVLLTRYPGKNKRTVWWYSPLKIRGRDTLEIQSLSLHASTAGNMGLIPGQGTKIPHVVQCGQKV